MKKLILLLLAVLVIASVHAQERARVNLATGDIIEYFTPRQAATPGVASKWVPVIRQAKPTFDPTTQFLIRSVVFINDTVVVDWTIGNKTQAQLDAIAAEAAARAVRQGQRQVVANAIATLRQWADDGAAVTVTNGNNSAVTQQMVDRLSVFFDRFADLVESQGIAP